MFVGIYDDERSWCEEAKTIIDKYAKEKGEDIRTKIFTCKKDFEAYGEVPMQVLFIDIELDEATNGISIAREVNKMWPKCQIVYLTNYLFYATEVYNTEHTYFVLKEQFEKRIAQIFEQVHYKNTQSEKKYLFTLTNGNNVFLNQEEIISFERNERVTVIRTESAIYETKEKISSIVDKLDTTDFVRCHHSCIVYLPAMKEMRKEEFVMKDGSKIIISRRYAKSVKEAFTKWAAKQML